jgi:predicted nucleic acid-binding protein
MFGDRILPFDTDAARSYGDLTVRARAAGRGFPTPDGYIAAIATAHDSPWRRVMPVRSRRPCWR